MPWINRPQSTPTEWIATNLSRPIKRAEIFVQRTKCLKSVDAKWYELNGNRTTSADSLRATWIEGGGQACANCIKVQHDDGIGKLTGKMENIFSIESWLSFNIYLHFSGEIHRTMVRIYKVVAHSRKWLKAQKICCILRPNETVFVLM